MMTNRLLKFSIMLGMILMVVALSFAGCGKATPTSTAPISAAPTSKAPTSAAPSPTTVTPKSGGILKVAEVSGSAILSLGYPATAAPDIDYYKAQPCIDTLFAYDKNLNVIPRLALSYSIASDSKSITLKLRQGVKFHDGSDFNAQVCQWNIQNYMKDNKSKTLQAISSVDVIDDYTVRINLSAYNNTILNKLCQDGGEMISKQSFDKNGAAWCEKNPVGTGPFKFISWEKDASIKYERFDGYWGGKVYLDGFWYVFYADSTSMVLAFKHGDFDIADINTLKDAKDLSTSGNYNVVSCKFGVTPALLGDSANQGSPFHDIRVRQAMSYAINLDEFNQSVNYGFGIATNQWAIPGTPEYNTNVVGYPFNPAKGKELMAAAGYANGFDCKLSFLAGAAGTTRATVVSGYLSAVGIRATLDPQQLATYDKTSTGGGWQNGICEQLTFTRATVLDSMGQVIPVNTLKYPSYARPAGLEDLFNKTLQDTDMNARSADTQKMQKIIVDDNCMATFLFVAGVVAVKQKYVHDDWWFEAAQGYLNPGVWMDK